MNEFKEEVIVKLIESCRSDDLLKLKDLVPEKLAELDSWIRLSEKFTQELLESQLICFFCSELLSENNINTQCYINRMDYDMPKNCMLIKK